MAALASSCNSEARRHYLPKDQMSFLHLRLKYSFRTWSTASVLPSLKPVFFHTFHSGSQPFVTENGVISIEPKIERQVYKTPQFSTFFPRRPASPGVSPSPSTQQTTRKKARNR